MTNQARSRILPIFSNRSLRTRYSIGAYARARVRAYKVYAARHRCAPQPPRAGRAARGAGGFRFASRLVLIAPSDRGVAGIMVLRRTMHLQAVRALHRPPASRVLNGQSVTRAARRSTQRSCVRDLRVSHVIHAVNATQLCSCRGYYTGSSIASSGSSPECRHDAGHHSPTFDLDVPVERRSIDEAWLKWGRDRRP